MWLFLPSGFYSIVMKPGDDRLTVRARVRADLERLRRRCPLGPIRAHEGTDYRYRAHVTREAFADAISAIAMDIDYSNFKSEVMRRLGPQREAVYHRVWSLLLHELCDDEPRPVGLEPGAPSAPRTRGRRRRRRS